MRGLAGWILSLVMMVGCAPSLTADQQACLECALRAHSDPEAARIAARDLASQCHGGRAPGATPGQARSCSVLGVMYEHGQGVRRDPQRAEGLYRAACMGGNTTGCVNLGRMLREGTSGRTDRAGAAAVFEAACHGDQPDGCYELARLRYESGQAAAALDLLDRACTRHHADACYGLGAIHAHGHGVAPDPERARSYFTQACARGHADACRRAVRRDIAAR